VPALCHIVTILRMVRPQIFVLPECPRYFQAAFDIEHTSYSEYCNTAASLMNQADNDRIQDLCSKIAVEQDRQKFLQLVQELNRILATKEKRLEKNEPSDRKGD
jgi:hypothetical protein